MAQECAPGDLDWSRNLEWGIGMIIPGQMLFSVTLPGFIPLH